MFRAAAPIQDQTYYLSSISEAVLARALFPLGDTKAQVRDLVREYEFPNAEGPENMGLCFVDEKMRFSNFICSSALGLWESMAYDGFFPASYIPPNPGPIVREDTWQRVQGLWMFSVGENACVQGIPQKMYVSDKDDASNMIYVVPGVYVLFLLSVKEEPDEFRSNNPRLFRNSIRVSEWQWIWGGRTVCWARLLS